MDILYLLGSGSKHDNIELRWALRGIEKYGKNIDRVFVVGEDPGFLSDEVIYIPCEDRFKDKHKNMLYKIQYAVLNSDISDIFLVSSDDIFVIKHFDANTLPMYCFNKLPEIIDRKYGKECYIYQLYNTRNFLITHHLLTYKFSIHCIHKMCRRFFEERRDLIMESLEGEVGIEPNCLVNNWMLRRGFPLANHADGKIMHGDEYEDVTKRILPDQTEFSVSDEVLNEYTIDAINRMYPNKCKWEK